MLAAKQIPSLKVQAGCKIYKIFMNDNQQIFWHVAIILRGLIGVLMFSCKCIHTHKKLDPNWVEVYSKLSVYNSIYYCDNCRYLSLVILTVNFVNRPIIKGIHLLIEDIIKHFSIYEISQNIKVGQSWKRSPWYPTKDRSYVYCIISIKLDPAWNTTERSAVLYIYVWMSSFLKVDEPCQGSKLCGTCTN